MVKRISTTQILDRLSGESLDLVIESLIYLLVQKEIIESPEEFVDMVEAVKFAKKLEKN
jgi:hypothetical protein